MNKQNMVKVLPTVLFITGIVGIFVSEVMAARDTLKAEKIIEDNVIIYDHQLVNMKNEDGTTSIIDNKSKRPFKEYAPEVIKATWKCYIPTALVTTLTITSLVMSKRLTQKQILALSTALASSGALIGKYRDKIREYASEETLHDIDKEITKSLETKEPKTYKGEIINDELGDFDEEIWVTDAFTKMRFRTTKLALRSAEYFYNMEFHCSPFGSISLERFYNLLGLTLPDEYKYCQWDIENFQDSYGIWIGFDHVPDDEGGYILYYDFEPEGGPEN